MQLTDAPMTDPRDEIDRIIQEAERKAFERGWQAACAAIGDLAKHLPLSAYHIEAESSSTPPEERLARRGRPSGRAIDIVADCIAAHPGMKGVEIVKAAQEVDPTIKERTVRTCLRRLRLNKIIWRRSGLWYPKPTEKTEAKNGIGEAVGSPPH